MPFTFKKLEINGLIEVEHSYFGDARGFFAETFREKEFADAGIKGPFVQENHSHSRKDVLRGLHYQLSPKAQGKLVRCVRGAIFDVAVDLRKSSPTFKKWAGLVLSQENHKMLWIPPGCAHGFFSITDEVDVTYKQTDYYSPAHERGIRWDDPDLAIKWPGQPAELSAKDAAYPFLKEAEFNFS